jgi:DNA-binding response OmpR family regulator
VIEGFKLGVDDFIAKPFNPTEELVLRVKLSFVRNLILFKESRNTCVTAILMPFAQNIRFMTTSSNLIFQNQSKSTDDLGFLFTLTPIQEKKSL